MPSRSVWIGWAVRTSSTAEMRARSCPSFSNQVTTTLASGWSWPPKRLCFTRAPLATPRFLPCSRVRKVTIRSRSWRSVTSRISASAESSAIGEIVPPGGHRRRSLRECPVLYGHVERRGGGGARFRVQASFLSSRDGRGPDPWFHPRGLGAGPRLLHPEEGPRQL